MAQILELGEAQFTPPAAAQFRILLIDCDELHARQVSAWLADRADMQLTCCAPGADLQRVLYADPWDLIIANLDEVALAALPTALPRLGGWGVPVLGIVRQLGVMNIRAALSQQVDNVLLRTYSCSELLDQIYTLVHEKREQRARQRQVTLAVGAHPDDVEIGCGGTLLKKRAMGHEVVVLILSRGAKGGDVNLRLEEAQQASMLLNATLKVGDLPDSQVPEGAQTIELIERVVREIAPTHIYTHSSHDSHQDHRNAHLATLVAARHTPNLYCYQSPSSTTDFRPNLFVDITNHMDKKVQMIQKYHSQVAKHAGLDSAYISATARYWGRHAGYGLVEPLEIIRQLDR
ncbi:PIG-L deacetylase family protein [Comamonas sp. MYb21]|uniref:PIG-L deacetylase family protein n=1 Tax=Comamonas sp. MYb21 TaxID=1848648 RepID=UPI0030B3F9F5